MSVLSLSGMAPAVAAGQEQAPVLSAWRWWQDPADAMTPRRAAAAMEDETGTRRGPPFTPHSLWLAARVQNPGPSDLQQVLSLPDGRIDRVEAWLVTDRGVQALPRLGYRYPQFDLQLPAGSGGRLLLRIAPEQPGDVVPLLYPRERIWQVRHIDYLYLGLVYGALLTMVVYHLPMAIALRDAAIGFVTLFMVTALTQALWSGGFGTILSGGSLSAMKGLALSWSIMGIWGVLAAIFYLELPKYAPGMARMGYALMFPVVVVGLLFPVPLPSRDLLDLTLIVATAWVLAASVYTIRQGRSTGYLAMIVALAYLVPQNLEAMYELGLLHERVIPREWLTVVPPAALLLFSLVIAHRIVVLRQRTERANRALRANKEELEQRVRERTAELLESATRAQAASKAKSDFLANMSHELRTPLTGILGYAEILRRDGLSRRDRAHAREVIERSGLHLLELIDDVLDLSRIEAGRLDLETTLLKPGKLLDEMADLFHNQARDKGLAFRYHGGNGLPATLIADGKRLRQILMNLLGNAVKYTDQGEISLRAWSKPTADGRVLLQVEVADTGPGIPDGRRDGIFQPFEQLAVGGRCHGIGLGLSISRQLASAMGGDLQVMGNSPRGSRFLFKAPFEVAEEVVRESRHQPLPVGYSGARRRLLVVDDNPGNLRLLGDLLRPMGFEIMLASGGREALEQIRREPPDLLLLDIHMPGMDGYATLEAIRVLPGCETLPAVAVSASVTRRDQEEVLLRGFDDFVSKPVMLVQLVDVLKTQLDLDWIGVGDDAAQETASVQLWEGIASLELDAETHTVLEAIGKFPSINELSELAEHLVGLGASRSSVELQRLGAELQCHVDAFDMPASRALIDRLQSRLDVSERRKRVAGA